jgi:hypothetical protein
VSDSGEWAFSSGSDDEVTSGNETTTTSTDAANKLKQLENQTVKNMGDLIEKNDLVIKLNQFSNESTTPATVNDVTAGVKDLSTDNNQVLKLTLRIRNAQGDLHDIKFEFNKATETVPDVVSEMVSANLIDERDAQPVTSTMTKLVENPIITTATFALKSYVDPSQPPDDKLLIGFAQLSLNT